MSLFEISLPRSVAKALRLPIRSPRRQQIRVLKKLLKKARFTEFGQQYRFDEILLSNHPVKKFRDLVPTFNYNTIYEHWWHRTLEGKRDVCWPGKVKYFALSSGTSEASSKYIPVTTDLMKGNRIVMLKQLLTLRNYTNFPVRSIGKGWFLISGSTDLQKGPGYYAGDLSGITTKRLPFWFTPFYKPGKKISRHKDWNRKLDEIVEKAPDWDISFIIGVPAWIQMVMERIIERYNLNTIHDIWPNLTLFVHGGVSFEPYKKGFEKLLGKPLIYIETYLASEGFLAYQDSQSTQSMRLVTNEHIFFEFVPFNDENFDAEGNMTDQPQALMINEVEEGKDYAILISTSAGAWRYLIGDTIRFTNKERAEIIITGRTKHFLSLVGEHLSVDNMTRAIQMVSDEMNVSIPEFTVAGVSHNASFSHDWFVGSNDVIDADLLCKKIDANLQALNDDYAVERKSELIDMSVNVFPEQKFIDFMRRHGKVGGQHKFPRVLKGKMYEDWKEFIASENG
ncbi:MAG: GH3 auxin-responsive promoter family protein [Williamsia sp.]|nr:GH3 auxin-responsive promoter family protein [Williamsia sp.]